MQIITNPKRSKKISNVFSADTREAEKFLIALSFPVPRGNYNEEFQPNGCT